MPCEQYRQSMYHWLDANWHMLSAYLIYMRDVGAKEFNIGVMTDDEVKDLFN